MLIENMSDEPSAPHSNDKPDENLILAAGKRAWKHLRRGGDFEEWVKFAKALEYGRKICLEKSRQKHPRGGKGYQRLIRAWFNENENRFDDILPNLRDKLFWLVRNESEVRKWRETLPLKRRLALNYPPQIQKLLKKSKQPAVEKPPRRISVAGIDIETRVKEEIERRIITLSVYKQKIEANFEIRVRGEADRRLQEISKNAVKSGSHGLSETQAQVVFNTARAVGARFHSVTDCIDPLCDAIISALGYSVPAHFTPRARYAPGSKLDRSSMRIGDSTISVARVKCLERTAV
jgi:hypothetical protein